jgi:NADPH:quinone reductase-like Zn-dependent oxidoreductase
MITTEAWVLHQGPRNSHAIGELALEQFALTEPVEDEVLVEPIYGCWEGNMTHALQRRPVDICRLRCEKRVVLGNAGVVRILWAPRPTEVMQEGKYYVVAPLGNSDPHGYPLRIFGYDQPGTVGLLAKKTKLRQDQLIPVPDQTRYRLTQWAASSVRMACAWDNWKVAWACWCSQMSDTQFPSPHVWAWGGGVALAELLLAKRRGCRVAMIASSDRRLRLIDNLGIRPIDRREFMDLSFDERRFSTELEYQTRYLAAERTFLEVVRRETCNERVSIFVDNIGTPVFRATLKALARQGVITTLGWYAGSDTSINRPAECIQRHIHVHTHGTRYSEALIAARYAEEEGWIPPAEDDLWEWDRIPQLAERFALGQVESYFPLFRVNNE